MGDQSTDARTGGLCKTNCADRPSLSFAEKRVGSRDEDVFESLDQLRNASTFLLPPFKTVDTIGEA